MKEIKFKLPSNADSVKVKAEKVAKEIREIFEKHKND